jgi:hypothetical protein
MQIASGLAFGPGPAPNSSSNVAYMSKSISGFGVIF